MFTSPWNLNTSFVYNQCLHSLLNALTKAILGTLPEIKEEAICLCFEIKLCKLIDISKYSNFKIYASAVIWTRDPSHPKRESYLYTIIAGLLHRILAFIDMKVSQVQPTLSWSLW